MTKKLTSILVTAGVALAALAIVLVQPWAGAEGGGQTATIETEPVDAAAASAAGTADRDGAIEGISVHGHWAIEVREADGRLVQRHEFENALTQLGSRVLANLMARQASLGTWGILLNSSTAPPCTYNALPSDCVILESAAGAMGGWPAETFPTLTLSPSTWDGSQFVEFVLQGTAIASADGTIDKVQSLICFSTAGGVAPLDCNNSQPFTEKFLGAPVAVSTGQQVLVTVTITFG